MQLKINRLNLFISLVAFLLVVNLLVLFDLNLFYLRAVLAFIFIIGVPGLLIMLSLKIRQVDLWEYLVYTIGLSISFIMFAGLAVNWILPWLNITDRPLDTIPIIVCFDIFLIALGFVAFKRNKDLKFEPKFPKLDLLNNIFFIIPMFFPVMAILGAFILNNGGPNYLTMVMLGAIAVYVLSAFIFREKLNDEVYPWALWLIGLSLLLMFSMRSWYVSGGDIRSEFKVFQFTNLQGIWKMSNLPGHAYNACISLNILPTILSKLTSINEHYIFKFIFQVCYSIIGIIIFKIAKKNLTSILAFSSSLLFIFFTGFIENSPIILRQEIAFIFFALIILTVLKKEINQNAQSILFFTFLLSLVISHYSTTYFAILIFFLWIVFDTILLKYNSSLKNKSFLSNKRLILLIFLIFSFMWYYQVTHSIDGLLTVSKESVAKFEQLNNQGLDSFYPKGNLVALQQEIQVMDQKYKINYSIYEKTTTPSFAIAKDLERNMVLNENFYNFIDFTNNNIDNVIKLFTVFGFVYVLVKKRKNYDLNYLVLSFILIGFLIFTRLLPFAGIVYDPLRLQYQSLIVIGIFSMIGFQFILKSMSQNKRYILISAIIIFYFMSTSGVINQLVGNGEPSMQLNNYGIKYDRWYSHASEIVSARWMILNYDYKSPILMDKFDFIKFPLIKDIFGNKKIIGVVSRFVTSESYVYADYPNTIDNTVLLYPVGRYLPIEFPKSALNQRKNKIYSNHESEIFK